MKRSEQSESPVEFWTFVYVDDENGIPQAQMKHYPTGELRELTEEEWDGYTEAALHDN